MKLYNFYFYLFYTPPCLSLTILNPTDSAVYNMDSLRHNMYGYPILSKVS
jgi:hypothetical protein